MTTEPTDTQAGNSGAGTQPPAAAGFTQEQVNSFLADERRKWDAKRKDEADKARADAEAKAAEQRGEFEQLANQRAARIAELEASEKTASERLSALEAEITAQADARLKALPKEIQDMKPESDDPLVVYRWLARAEQAATKLAAPAPPPRTGTPPGPRNGGAPASVGSGGDVVNAKRASGDYSF